MNFGSFLYTRHGSDASKSETFAKAGVWRIAVTKYVSSKRFQKDGIMQSRHLRR